MNGYDFIFLDQTAIAKRINPCYAYIKKGEKRVMYWRRP